MRHRVFQLLTQYSHPRLLGCASSCFLTAHSIFNIQYSHLRLLVGASSCFSTAYSILTSSTLRLCVVFQLLTQYSHLRLLACVSSCFSTAYSILTSSTLRRCIIVFFNCLLNTHCFDFYSLCVIVFFKKKINCSLNTEY